MGIRPEIWLASLTLLLVGLGIIVWSAGSDPADAEFAQASERSLSTDAGAERDDARARGSFERSAASRAGGDARVAARDGRASATVARGGEPYERRWVERLAAPIRGAGVRAPRPPTQERAGFREPLTVGGYADSVGYAAVDFGDPEPFVDDTSEFDYLLEPEDRVTPRHEPQRSERQQRSLTPGWEQKYSWDDDFGGDFDPTY